MDRSVTISTPRITHKSLLAYVVETLMSLFIEEIVANCEPWPLLITANGLFTKEK